LIGVQPDVLVSEQEKGVPVDQTPGKKGNTLSHRAKEAMDLRKKVAGDAVLRRATDILLAVKALGIPRSRRATANVDDTEAGRADTRADGGSQDTNAPSAK